MDSASAIRKRTWILTTIIAAYACSTATAAEPLRWKFRVGDSLVLRNAQEMQLKIEGGSSGPLSTTTGQILDMTWNVKDVNAAGDAIVIAKIDRVRMRLEDAEQRKLEYDSESEDPPTGMASMQGSIYEAMSAGEYEIRMSTRGEVRDVVIPEKVRLVLEANADEEVTGEQFLGVFKAVFTQGVFVLPEEPPAVGDEWSASAAVSIPGADTSTVETTYRYEGTRAIDGTTVAVIRPTLKMNPSGESSSQVTVKEQRTEGEVLFDETAGRLHSMSIEQNMTLEIRAGEKTTPATIRQTIDVTMTPKGS